MSCACGASIMENARARGATMCAICVIRALSNKELEPFVERPPAATVDELTKQLADVLRGVPHADGCARTVGVDHRCTCEVGGRLLVIMQEFARLLAPRVGTDREQFVERMISLMESAPETASRDIGESLVGMGVALLNQLGVDPQDIAKSILDRRNAS